MERGKREVESHRLALASSSGVQSSSSTPPPPGLLFPFSLSQIAQRGNPATWGPQSQSIHHPLPAHFFPPPSIHPVGGRRLDPIRFRSRDRSSKRVRESGIGRARHGGTRPCRRRQGIGGEGRRLGCGPGGRLGLAGDPADALFRLHLPLLRSRGCFGFCDKAVKQVGELSKSLMASTQNPTVGEEFWSTTTIEVDPADLRGVSSVHTSSWDLEQYGVGSSHNPPEFVNPGISLWKQTRQEWTNNGRQQPIVKQIREPLLSWNAAYESLLGSNKPFRQPIPLHEMVDFLVDIWEQEGLYD